MAPPPRLRPCDGGATFRFGLGAQQVHLKSESFFVELTFVLLTIKLPENPLLPLVESITGQPSAQFE